MDREVCNALDRLYWTRCAPPFLAFAKCLLEGAPDRVGQVLQHGALSGEDVAHDLDNGNQAIALVLGLEIDALGGDPHLVVGDALGGDAGANFESPSFAACRSCRPTSPDRTAPTHAIKQIIKQSMPLRMARWRRPRQDCI